MHRVGDQCSERNKRTVRHGMVTASLGAATTTQHSTAQHGSPLLYPRGASAFKASITLACANKTLSGRFMCKTVPMPIRHSSAPSSTVKQASCSSAAANFPPWYPRTHRSTRAGDHFLGLGLASSNSSPFAPPQDSALQHHHTSNACYECTTKPHSNGEGPTLVVGRHMLHCSHVARSCGTSAPGNRC